MLLWKVKLQIFLFGLVGGLVLSFIVNSLTFVHNVQCTPETIDRYDKNFENVQVDTETTLQPIEIPIQTITTSKNRITLISDEEVSKFWKKFSEDHKKNLGATKKRVVKWGKSETWGYGNHLIGLTSVLLYAICTDRVILVNDEKVMGKVINWPIDWKWSSFQEKNLQLKNFGPQNEECYFTDKGIGKEMETLDFESIWGPHDFPIIEMICNCPAFHWMARNPLYRSKLQDLKILPSSPSVPVSHYGFYAASNIAKIFFDKINPSYISTITEIVKSWKQQGYYVIGLQIRFGEGADARFLNSLDGLHNCIANTTQEAPKDKNVKYFIATDSNGGYDEIYARYPDKVLPKIEGRVVHIGINNRWDDNEFDKIIIENYLLGECDELVITPASTYGGMAAIRKGILPLVMRDSYCERSSPDLGPHGRNMPTYLLW